MFQSKTEQLWQLAKTLTDDEIHRINGILNNEHPTQEKKFFDYLLQSENYDGREALRSAGVKKAGVLKVIKSELRQKIMNVLRTGKAANRSIVFARLMEEHEICLSRGLIMAAYKTSEKAEKMAMKYGAPLYKIHALNNRMHLMQFAEGRQAQQKIIRLSEELYKAGKETSAMFEAHHFYARAHRVMARTAFLRSNDDIKTIRQLTRHSFYHENENKRPYHTRCFLLMARHWILTLKGNFRQALKQQHWFYLLVKERMDRGIAEPTEILGMYMDYLTACLLAADYALFDKALREYSGLRKRFFPGDMNYEGIEIYFESYSLYYRNNYSLHEPEYQRLIDFYGKNRSSPQIYSVTLRGMEFLIAFLYYKSQMFDEALAACERLVAVKSTTPVRADDVEYGKLLHVILLFDSSVLVKSKKVFFRNAVFKIRAGQYYESVRKSPDNYSLEKRVFRLFINMKDGQSLATLGKAVKTLGSDIRQMKAAPGNEYMTVLLKMFPLENWLEEFSAKIRET